MVYFRLISAALFPVLIAFLFYRLEKKTAFGRWPYLVRQLLIGLIFGGIACAATQFGIPMEGYVINVRTAAPLTAALVFGGPSGILAGVIGGVYRWLSVMWGIGAYTKVACSVATVLAGLIGAMCRKFMFDNKKASWFYGFFIAIVTEVLHMLLVFVTHIDDIHHAFLVVKVTTLPMVLGNGFSVMLALLLISSAKKEKNRDRAKRPITQTFTVYLFLVVLVAYIFTSMFTLDLQNNVSEYQVKTLIKPTISDVKADLDHSTDADLLKSARLITADITEDADLAVLTSDIPVGQPDALRDKLILLQNHYHVSEINLVGPDGRITLSTNPSYDGFDMGGKKDGQAAEFLCLLTGSTEYVQGFTKKDIGDSTSMKYAGVALAPGFVQVGYDAEYFADSVSDNLYAIAQNRHIGQEGFVFILNAYDNEVVSAPENTVNADSVRKYVEETDFENSDSFTFFTDVKDNEY